MKGWQERIVELSRDYGLNYHEISQIILQEYGFNISDDTVRYHATRKFKKQEEKTKEKDLGISRTLILSDLHIPFHREEVILEIIKKHRDKIDTIIFGGDIVDCESISKFPKEERKPLIFEMVIAYKFLKRIDRLTPNIKKILIWGNHEYRFAKYLAVTQNELSSLHSSNILNEIINGFSYYNKKEKRKYVYPKLSDNFVVVDKWYYQHNDMIIAHPKNYSVVNLKTSVNTLNHFIAKGFNFNCLFIGHTHKWGHTTKYNKWIGELGCLCESMEYSDNGNVSYTPQDYGYALFTHINGITKINQSRLYKLDLEDSDKNWKEIIYDDKCVEESSDTIG